MDGTLRPDDEKAERNNIFGRDTIWMAEDLEGAKNFAYENLFGPRGFPKRETTYNDRGYKIYKIDVRGLPYKRLWNIGNDPEMVKSTHRLSLSDNTVMKNDYLRSLQKHLSYSRNMAPNNKEVAVEGPIESRRITLVQGDTPLPHSEHTSVRGRHVQRGMDEHFGEMNEDIDPILQ